MTTLQEIEDALYNYAVFATGQKWIHQTSEEAPELPYGVIRMQNISQVGTEANAQTTILPDDIEQKADAFFSIQYDFLYRGDGARQVILDLVNKSNLEDAKTFFRDQGIGFEFFLGITDLTGLDIDVVREQAMTTLQINAVITAEQIVPIIKTVEIERVET
jgi:hypothetical protein